MSDREALKIFSRQPVSNDMIQFLAATTSSIIQVKSLKSHYSQLNSSTMVAPVKKTISLVSFIKNLIRYSNVQTPTLMATLIYLNKLRNLLPANAVGMETTRHRIFLSALILSAKSLNDSSPLNKHWTKYTDGLLSLDEVNMAEHELIGLLKWNITVKEDELIVALQPFLTSIKKTLVKKQEDESMQKINFYRLSNSYTNKSLSSPSSLNSSSTLSSISTSNSVISLDRTQSPRYYTHDEEHEPVDHHKKRMPLSSKSINSINVPRQVPHLKSQNHSYYDCYDEAYYNSGINLMNSGKVVS